MHLQSANGGDLHGFIARDRPYFDDLPADRHGWKAASRWGSRPVRAFRKALESGLYPLLVVTVLAISALVSVQTFTSAEAVSAAAGKIDRVRLGFALDREGSVAPGCAASKFALSDPIHLSMQVTGAAAGSEVVVSVRDVVSRRVAWSERRAVPPGRSALTFDIGRGLALGRYRAESTLGGVAMRPWEFEVHDRREFSR